MLTITGQCSYIAPGDFIHTDGTILITEYETLQCVNISIISDSEDEQELECFAFAISPNNQAEELSLQNSQATLCIRDDDGMSMFTLL